MAGVLDALAPGEKAVIVGHSFGGAVALRLALDRPDLVKGLDDDMLQQAAQAG